MDRYDLQSMKILLMMRFLSLSLVFLQIHAWWNYGHMLVGQIATEIMDENDVEIIHLLLKGWDDDFPNTGDITTACIWADLMKCNSIASYCPSPSTPSLSSWNSWHYMNLPLQLNSTVNASTADLVLLSKNLEGTADKILEQLITTLHTTRSKWTFNYAIRLFVHIFGDVHNPMHSTTGVNDALPHGDAGGNLITLQPPCSATNLHEIWDNIAGTGTLNWSPEMDIHSNERRIVNSNATRLLQKFAALQDPLHYERLKNLSYDEFDHSMTSGPISSMQRIILESYDIARHEAYVGLKLTCNTSPCIIECPSEVYQRRLVKTAEARIVLGGKRLAIILAHFARQLRKLNFFPDD